ncbi:nitrate reductase cytochrome c-type subunit [Dyella caseinilytica]|uniref:Periplasmic nitrate reductase, electron transfer subunit n=2 Tax=Dyella caseinilytica TaxID=1849581 RepID=A0ABX7H0B4_9GAMM|nr:nitrate reductase cytochrome c-type subunit [Dyella caseinilytica]
MLPHIHHEETATQSPPASAQSAPVARQVASRATVPPETNTPVATNLDALRRGIPINQEAMPLPMAAVENNDVPRERNYPMQPPTIPHSIDNYQVDKNYNRCLMCHTRANAAKFNAPAIAASHYVTREGQVLAQISPRRYFCTQCHVPQTNAKPLVGNTYQYDTAVIQAAAKNGQ